MLHDGAVNRPTQICVLVSDDPSFVSYAVVDVLGETLRHGRSAHKPRNYNAYLQPALAQELVTRAEGHLYNRPQLGQLLRRVVLDVRDALP